MTGRPAHVALLSALAALLVGAGNRPSPGARGPTTQLRVGFLRPGGGYAVETLGLESYVARVLAGEAARGSGPASLEALAITVRTFALANRGRHRADGFDLCDQTHCQVVRAATPATERAAAATAGEALVDDGEPASIYYTASCGGRTEIPSAVWPGADDPPYLPSVVDDACGGAPAWSAELSARDLARALALVGYRGRVRAVQVAKRDPSGRVSRLRLDGLTPDVISGQDFRVAVGRSLGWLLVKSAAFDVERRGDSYRFSGRGSGHGVGLCVIGSAHLAAEGESAAQILARYFPGLAIATMTPGGVAEAGRAAAARRLRAGSSESHAGARPTGERADASDVRRPAPPPSDVLVMLPDGDEGERTVVASLVSRARDDLARRLGVGAPRPIVVRFHPTTDSYERATHQRWFTAGSVVAGELQMPPVAVLRERGVLDRAIRQDLVRLMTGAALADRPMWVREGAAAYFADSGAVRPDPRDAPSPFVRPEPRRSCPGDNELRAPVSIGALSNAYARARACFERELARRKDWRAVK